MHYFSFEIRIPKRVAIVAPISMGIHQNSSRVIDRNNTDHRSVMRAKTKVILNQVRMALNFSV